MKQVRGIRQLDDSFLWDVTASGKHITDKTSKTALHWRKTRRKYSVYLDFKKHRFYIQPKEA